MKAFFHYLIRTWWLGILVILSNWLTVWTHAIFWVPDGHDKWGHVVWRGVTIVEAVGSSLYALPLALTFAWLTGLSIAMFFQNTLEADVQSGRVVDDWNAITSSQRSFNTTIIRAAWAIAIAIVVAAVAK